MRSLALHDLCSRILLSDIGEPAHCRRLPQQIESAEAVAAAADDLYLVFFVGIHQLSSQCLKPSSGTALERMMTAAIEKTSIMLYTQPLHSPPWNGGSGPQLAGSAKTQLSNLPEADSMRVQHTL